MRICIDPSKKSYLKNIGFSSYLLKKGVIFYKGPLVSGHWTLQLKLPLQDLNMDS